MPIQYPGNAITKAARAKAGVGFESAIEVAGNGITGSITDGQTITILSDGANGFGSLVPTTEFFSDFSEIPTGTRLDASSPTVGSFYGASPNLVSSAYSHSGDKSFEGVIRGDYGISRIALPNDPAAIMVSYWTLIPAGKAMPAYEIDSFAIKSGISASSWKLGWLSTGDSVGDADFGGSDGGDLCIPSNNSADSWVIGGNSTGDGFYQADAYVSPSEILTHGEWLLTWVIIDPDNAGIIKVRHLSKTKGFFEFSDVIDNTFWGSSANQFWQFFNLPGYARPGDALTDAEVHHDDVLIQGGAAAGLSVFIGDASTLAECTDIQMLRVSAVSASEVSAVIGVSPFASYSGKYLFVTDSQGDPVQYNGADSRLIP